MRPAGHRGRAWTRVPLAVLVVLPLLSGCLGDEGSDPPPPVLEDPATHPLYPLYAGIAAAPEVRFVTDHGEIRLLLYTELLPTTAARMAELTKAGFYDGTLVHRVVDDFVIQGGDPSKTGQSGSGETVPFESHPDLQFGFGAVGLARDLDPDSGDSQWFITERPAPHLHAPTGPTGAVFGSYSLYAQAFDGMDVVRAIAKVPVIPGLDRPVQDIVLKEAKLLPPPPDLDVLAFPTHLDGPFAIGPGDIWIERPLHLFAGHPATLRVELRPKEGATAPPGLDARFVQGDADVNMSLAPLPDDVWVFEGQATIPEAGDWELSVSSGGIVGGPVSVTVEPLGPVLRGLLRIAS